MQATQIYLLTAIVSEVIGTAALNASQGFTRLWPSVLTVVSYGSSFYLLSLTLKTTPIGIVYAIWSGLGIVLISLMGWLLFKQRLDAPAILGIALIIVGVVVIQVFSRMAAH